MPDVLKTVLSTAKDALLSVTAEVIPSPPSNVNVFVPTVTVSVPLSPAILKAEEAEIAVLVTEDIRPSASTVKTGIVVLLPYVPADTPVSERSTVRVTLAEPSKETLPVASPARPMSRAVFNVVAVVALPVTFAVIVAAVKLPSASRLTIAEAVFAEVAASTNAV